LRASLPGATESEAVAQNEPTSEDSGLGYGRGWNVVDVCSEALGAYSVRCLPAPAPHLDRCDSRPVES